MLLLKHGLARRIPHLFPGVHALGLTADAVVGGIGSRHGAHRGIHWHDPRRHVVGWSSAHALQKGLCGMHHGRSIRGVLIIAGVHIIRSHWVATHVVVIVAVRILDGSLHRLLLLLLQGSLGRVPHQLLQEGHGCGVELSVV